MSLGILAPIPWQQAIGLDGLPLPGALLTTYAAGTSTKLATYSDPDLDPIHANANPLVAGADGVFGPIFLSPQTYKFVLQTAAAVVIRTQDDIAGQIPVPTLSPADFGTWTGDDSTDNYPALNAAYAAAKATGRTLWLPADGLNLFRFQTGLVWDGQVNICADPGVILKKVGNIVGITITTQALCVIEGFTLTSAGGPDASDGIHFNSSGAAAVTLRNLYISNQGGHGLVVLGAANDYFENITSVSNAGDGVRLAPTGSDYVNANVFKGLDVRANGGYGLNIAGGGLGTQANQCVGVVAQNNTNYGIRVNDLTNYLVGYVEANTAGDVLLDTASTRCMVTLLNSSVTNPAVIDNGTNNIAFDLSTGRIWLTGVRGAIPGTNVAGRDVVFGAGNAGAGGTGRAGGTTTITSGDAAGTAGAADGGYIAIYTGAGVNGGVSPGIAINGSTKPAASVGMDFQSTVLVPRLPRLTTTEQNALTAVDGLIIFNTSTNRVRAYYSGAWNDL